MEAFLFGSPGRRLFGCWHQALASAPLTGIGVLLCAPFGQEAIRTQRMFRVLAERLARAGVAVLRFDYAGTGDSEGDDLDFNLRRGVEDILTAQARLIQLAVPRKLVWVSLRLGASMAFQALAEPALARKPDHIVAWEPVLDGAAYLDSLRRDHVEALEASYTVADPSWRRHLVEEPGSFREEAMGFALSDTLRSELGQFTAASIAPVRCKRVTVLSPDSGQAPELAALPPTVVEGRLDTLTLNHDFSWTSEEALNTALVPAQAVQKLFDLCLED